MIKPVRYTEVTRDITKLAGFIDYFEDQLEEGKKECSARGNIEKNLRDLPGITEHRFNQLQEIEAVLKYLEIEHRKIRKKHFQKYLEHYNRALTSRDAEKYAEAEDEVIDFEVLINEVALLRNKYLGLMKGLDTKQWQLGHIARLRTAGLEDVTL